MEVCPKCNYALGGAGLQCSCAAHDDEAASAGFFSIDDVTGATVGAGMIIGGS